jgi:hypothetical protein
VIPVDLSFLAGLILGTIFVLSGSSKLLYRTRFQDTLGGMEILPRWLTVATAWVLPPLEILVGGAVSFEWHRWLSAVAVLSLLACFVGVLVYHRLRGGYELACGCFADFDHKARTSHLILRNAVLLALGLLLVVPASDPPATRDVRDWVEAGLVVVGLGLGWVLTKRLAEVRRLLEEERKFANSWRNG